MMWCVCTVNCKEIVSSHTLNFPRRRTRFRTVCTQWHMPFDLFWLENPDYINYRIHYQTRFDNNQSALSQTMCTVCQPITACSQDLGNPAVRWCTISDGVTQTSLFSRATKEVGDVCTHASFALWHEEFDDFSLFVLALSSSFDYFTV